MMTSLLLPTLALCSHSYDTSGKQRVAFKSPHHRIIIASWIMTSCSLCVCVCVLRLNGRLTDRFFIFQLTLPHKNKKIKAYWMKVYPELRPEKSKIHIVSHSPMKPVEFCFLFLVGGTATRWTTDCTLHIAHYLWTTSRTVTSWSRHHNLSDITLSGYRILLLFASKLWCYTIMKSLSMMLTETTREMKHCRYQFKII